MWPLLLTKEDFRDKARTLNIRNTLFTLLDEGVVPIINENDTVCVEEIKLGTMICWQPIQLYYGVETCL